MILAWRYKAKDIVGAPTLLLILTSPDLNPTVIQATVFRQERYHSIYTSFDTFSILTNPDDYNNQKLAFKQHEAAVETFARLLVLG